jgi:hypothetical protein
MIRDNNHRGDGGRVWRDVGEEARESCSVWGGGVQSFEVTNSAQKKSIIKYTVALDGRWRMNLHTTTNQKQAPIIEESRERRQAHRGVRGGGCIFIILAAIEWGV